MCNRRVVAQRVSYIFVCLFISTNQYPYYIPPGFCLFCSLLCCPVHAFALELPSNKQPARLNGRGNSPTQPCSQNFLLLLILGCHPRHRRRPSYYPPHPLSSVSSDSSRPACVEMPGCPGPTGSESPGPAQSTPCPRRCRKWRKYSRGLTPGLFGALILQYFFTVSLVPPSPHPR